MGCKHRALANSLGNTFPDPDIIYMYTAPLVSSLAKVAGLVSASSVGRPDMVEITHLCELYFPWGESESIISKFDTGVFPAIVMMALRDAAILKGSRGFSPAISASVSLFMNR